MTSVPGFARFGTTLVVTIPNVQLRDAETVQRLKEAILLELNEDSLQDVVLDVGAVEFVGSVAFLAFLANRRERPVNKIFLCNLRENVREVFVLCRLLGDAEHSQAPFLEATSVAEAIEYLTNA
jgi:anti-anti-sigma factor